MKKCLLSILLIFMILFCQMVTVAAEENNIIDNTEKNNIETEKSENSESELNDNNESSNTIKEDNSSEIEKKDENIQTESSSTNVRMQKSTNLTRNAEEQINPSRTIEDGEYEIRSAVDTTRIFDVDTGSNPQGAKLQLWHDNDVTQQRFYITHIGNGYYKITSRRFGKVIEVAGGENANGAKVQQYDANGSDQQAWIIKDAGDGYYNIISKCSKKYMTTVNNSGADGTAIQTFERNDSLGQKFKFDKVLKDTPQSTIEDGEYETRSAIDNSRIFDIDTGSNPRGAKLQLWYDNDVVQQRFYISSIGGGYYKIISRKTWMSLDVKDSGISNGTKVQQYDYHGGDAQSWIIKDAGDGYYNIISKCNGYYMTTANAKDGTSVLLYESNGTKNQKFKLHKVFKDTPKQIIADGEYEIRSAVDTTRIFDIDTGSNPRGAKLQLWHDNDVDQQRFNIVHIGGGYYKITSRKTGMGLDVQDASLKNGTRVQQYDYYGGNAQAWIIKDAGDGYYNIIAKCSGYYMTAANAKDGTSILLNESNESINQKFKLDKVLKDTPKQIVEDGEYEIRSAIDNSQIFDIDTGSSPRGAKLQLWYDNDVSQQRFNIVHIGGGYYKITSRKTGMGLDVQDAGIKNGTRVQQYDYYGGNAQSWVIKDAGDGYYNIIAKCNGYYMTTANSKNGTSVLLYESNGSKNQKFKLDKVLKDKPVKSVENGEYKIRSAIDNSRVFDIDTGSAPQGAKLQLWHDNNVSQQRFYITNIGGGYYKIISKRSGKGLDVKDAGISNGTVVQQYDYYGGNAQAWIIKDAGDGYYNIIAKCNGYYMTASTGKDGNQVLLYERNDGKSQKFKLERVKSDEIGIDVSSHNGTIDWSQVKASGVGFAMIRVGYRGYETGKVVSDTKFEYNIENAIKNNIDVGVYFYSQAITQQEAIDEAKFVVSMIKKYKITCPVVFDSEFVNGDRVGRADWLSVSERTAICKAFCNEIAKSGYEPMVYASKSWFYDELIFSQLSNYSIWVAHYTYDPNKKTNFKYSYNMWQYTDSGKVPGINGNVDIDIRY